MIKKQIIKYKTSIRTKIVLLISIIAVVIPMFSAISLGSIYSFLGVEKIFSSQVSNSVQETVKIAKLYLQEHINSIKIDILTTAHIVDDNPFLFNNKAGLNAFLQQSALQRSLSEIIIFTTDGKVIGKNELGFSLLFEILPNIALEVVDKPGNVYVHRSGDEKVQAVVKLFNISRFMEKDVYMLMGRYIDSEILDQLEESESFSNLYTELYTQMDDLRVRITCSFIVLSLIILLIALVVGNRVGLSIIKPLNWIAEAAAKIEQGEYGTRVEGVGGQDELGILVRTFNSMSSTIKVQHKKLAQANSIIDQRRVFIETVLSELTAGVIALDSNLTITLSNSSACSMLGIDSLDGLEFGDVFPELMSILTELLASAQDSINCNITIIRNKSALKLFVKAGIVREVAKNEIQSIVIAFDDITEFSANQRFKAWSEVARRVAHEIKNPLTPIQLAVNRLQKKIMPLIASEKDQSSFLYYTEIIDKRVEDIKIMVSDLLTFAKLSTPRLQREDICQIIAEVVLLEKASHPNIEYQCSFGDGEVCYVLCDKMQIAQVLTNLLKNSAESINSLQQNHSNHNYININIIKSKETASIVIEDSGAGIDPKILDSIGDPYITTKSNGTGLGLAIVSKIIDEHKAGQFMIQDKAIQNDKNKYDEVLPDRKQKNYDQALNNNRIKKSTHGAIATFVLKMITDTNNSNDV